MSTQETKLWCKIIRRRVKVVLVTDSEAPPRAGLPKGWRICACRGRDTRCYSSACPFTVEQDAQPHVAWPFEMRSSR